MLQYDDVDGPDGGGDGLFALEFFTLFDKIPPEIHDKLVQLVAEFFISFLFLEKHLPNGPCGEMVNGESSVLRDLSAYLYITNDPCLLEYPINSIGVLREKATNRIISVKVFILTMKTQTIEIGENGGQIPIQKGSQTLQEAAPSQKTGFRDKNEVDIWSNHMVFLDGEVYAIVREPSVNQLFDIQWCLKNEKKRVLLMDCHSKVEIFESIRGL